MTENQPKSPLSIGKLIGAETFRGDALIPEEVKEKIGGKGDYFLLIFVPREDVVKISVFPCKSSKIKKILIQLQEFSPELVKGISQVLNDLELTDYIMHTTGLCFSAESCYYETYLDTTDIANDKLAGIKDKFMEVPSVMEVEVTPVPVE
ncbi:MAG: hypothetical protein ACTSU5_01045 [Promethearchaeota archaeon]